MASSRVLALGPRAIVPLLAITAATTLVYAQIAPTTAKSTAGLQSGAGSALLANFPLPAGAVRKSFISNRHTDSWQEHAVYSTAGLADKVANDYAQQIAAAGWSPTSSSSTGTIAAGTYRSVQDYLLGATKGHVIIGIVPGAGVSVDVTVTTTFGGATPLLAIDVTAAPATGATSSPSDQGAADPSAFPRLPGSVRSSYEASVATNTRRETANYTASSSADSAEAFFRQGLSQAQWNETYRYIEIDDVRHATKIQNTWQTSGRTASMTMTAAANGGSTLLLVVTTSETTSPTTSTGLTPKTASPPTVPSASATSSSTAGGTPVVGLPGVSPTTIPGTQSLNPFPRVTALTKFSAEYAGPASFRLRWSCEDDEWCVNTLWDHAIAPVQAPPLDTLRPYSYEIYKKSANETKFTLVASTNTVNIYCTQSHPEVAGSGEPSNDSADFCGPDAPTTIVQVCDLEAAEWNGIVATTVATPATFRIFRRDPSGKLLGVHADVSYNPLRVPAK